MSTTEDSSDGPTGRPPSPCGKPVVVPSASRFAGTLWVVAMLGLAAGVVALECGLYQAFDDNRLRLDASVARSALALFGSTGVDPDAPPSGPSTADPAR